MPVFVSLLACIVLLLGMAPPPASAGVDVSVADDGTAVLNPSPHFGERMRFVLEHFADSSRNGIRVRQLGFGDPAIVTQDSDCQQNSAFNDVVCRRFPADVIINLSSESDEIVVGGSNVGCEATTGTPVLIVFNSGDDILRTSTSCGGQSSVAGVNRLHPAYATANGGGGHDDLAGGRLNDVMNGGPGDDELFGGAGNDQLDGDGGDDEVRGSSGNDVLDGGPDADRLDGGSGVDRADYAGRPAVTVTLDGNANDGPSGEGDNLVSVENVTGTSNADRIIGSAGANTLEGGAGNDELTGGDGTDVLRGQDGDDLIDSRDGVGESVNCGTGSDAAIADLEDTFVRSSRTGPSTCENVQRFAVDDGPPGRITRGSVHVPRSGALRIRIACPRRARVDCRGTIRLTRTGRGRPLAEARYSVRRRRTQTVRLRLPRRVARQVRARGSLVATTRERGVSRKGPRSAIRRLAVR